jgi:hypothetical protein
MSHGRHEPGRKLRGGRLPRTATSRNESTGDWSHEQVVMHRLACGRRTLNSMRTIIESSLNEYYDKKSNKDWKSIVDKVATFLPHGHYELKLELYRKLRPEIYPYDDEEDQKYVIGEMEKYRGSHASQPQGPNRRAELKRAIISDDDGEDEVRPIDKKAKGETKASSVKQPAGNPISSQVERLSLPCSVTTIQASDESYQQQLDIPPRTYKVTKLETKNKQDLESFIEELKMSTLVQEIEALKNGKSSLQKRLEEVESLKTAAVKLQQDTKKDEQIKKLQASNSAKDILITRLQELSEANTAIQSQGTAAQTIQKLQQELLEKDRQIGSLNSRNNHSLAATANERHLRAAADRRLLETARESQNAIRQYQEAVKRANFEHQRNIELGQRLASTEEQLRAAWMREHSYLADDERRLQERRSATQQWW